MYRIKDSDGKIITQTTDPIFVRKKESTGAWVRCNQFNAECIAIDCQRYSLDGKEIVEDAPQVVTIEKIDEAAESLQHSKTLDTNSRDIELLAYAVNKMAEEVVNAVIEITPKFRV